MGAKSLPSAPSPCSQIIEAFTLTPEGDSISTAGKISVISILFKLTMRTIRARFISSAQARRNKSLGFQSA